MSLRQESIYIRSERLELGSKAEAERQSDKPEGTTGEVPNQNQGTKHLHHTESAARMMKNFRISSATKRRRMTMTTHQKEAAPEIHDQVHSQRQKQKDHQREKILKEEEGRLCRKTRS